MSIRMLRTLRRVRLMHDCKQHWSLFVLLDSVLVSSPHAEYGH